MYWIKVGAYVVPIIVLLCLLVLSLKPESRTYRQYFRLEYAEDTLLYEVAQIVLGIIIALVYAAMLPIAWPLARLGIIKPLKPQPWYAPKLTEDLIAEAEERSAPIGKVCGTCRHDGCRCIGHATECPECEDGLLCKGMKNLESAN